MCLLGGLGLSEARFYQAGDARDAGSEEHEGAGFGGSAGGDVCQKRHRRFPAGCADGEEGEDFGGTGWGEGEALLLPAGEAHADVVEDGGVEGLATEADVELLGCGGCEVGSLLLGSGEVEG